MSVLPFNALGTSLDTQARFRELAGGCLSNLWSLYPLPLEHILPFNPRHFIADLGRAILPLVSEQTSQTDLRIGARNST